jgi:hypothetical protein
MNTAAWRRACVAAEGFLARRGFWLLAAFAVVYYALYFDTGLQLTGEQGSNALIAMRILDGERPIADMFIGYNLLWFYPLVGIFALLGPHWLAMRIYFLVLAAVTALLGYALVRRVTGLAWAALLTGLFMVLMPGAIFRNYLGFIGILAATVLLRGYVLPAATPAKQIGWMALAGAGLAVCFLALSVRRTRRVPRASAHRVSRHGGRAGGFRRGPRTLCPPCLPARLRAPVYRAIPGLFPSAGLRTPAGGRSLDAPTRARRGPGASGG